MIEVTVLYGNLPDNTDEKFVCGFKIKNHGDSIVCAGVSALVMNAINSVEVFTDAGFSFDGDAENGGDVTFVITEFDDEGKAELLIQSLYLGLISISERYDKDIVIYE
jgi:uncharacterized protein YsxB (DUF464 family)